jgi:predicted adenine nucleotide alpha hydrolase (AANH) superfamily ATPase
MSEIKNKILLHICCAGCGAFASQLLAEDFKVTLFFYNPNIFPQSECDIRVQEVKIVAKEFNLNLHISDYNHDSWLNKIKGHEGDREKGERCIICYHDRLEHSVKFAKENGFDFFTSTLTVSPHKLANKIINIGKELELKYNIKFLAKDFKKQDGFKKSMILSSKLGLYRQNYCGCEFSRR